MTLHEPVTLLTDWLLAALAAWLAWRLHRAAPAANRAAQWWSCALALTAASALIGGSYHGFAPNFSSPVGAMWWRLTLLTVNLLSAAMAVSWVHENLRVRWHRTLFIAITVKFLAIAIIVMRQPEFLIAIIDYSSTMLAWLAAAAILPRAWRRWMLAALALSGLGAAVQQLHWAPTARFNHNDLYHVLQIGAIAAFYRAGRRFGAMPS